MTVLAEIDGLRIETGGRTLVDGVRLRVRPGRVTALVGPSGSGKTTTALALLGEYPPGALVSGRVSTAGGPIGYVPQHPAAVLNPVRRVGVLLRDIARGTGGGPEAVHRALRQARLDDVDAVLRRYPHQLSGGQQQRVVLAQALLLGARVIIADEPTTGQDPATKRLLTAELARLAEQGLGLVLLSHDLDVVRELADEAVLLDRGRTVASGPPAEVLAASAVSGAVTVSGAVAVPGPRRRAADRPVRLEATGLTAHHPGGAPVLHDVALTLHAGECLALVGRSGSGKTTLGRCLAGLHTRHRGTLRLDGHPLPRSTRRRSRAQLAAVQYVFQDARAAFADHRTIADQVARAAVRLRGLTAPAARAEALALLTGLGLATGQADRPPGRLSGGELQRAALARALIVRPAVLVCDEITSGLDTATRTAVLDHLRERRDHDGLALLLITHDPATAALADAVLELSAGRPSTPRRPTGPEPSAHASR
ncbi:ABC transporter ATP-binding protein [Kitasatospora sp. NPDC054939]